ncbi:MAG: hypothetical protein WCF85_12610 [Rhodospirillaceae bacterium]
MTGPAVTYEVQVYSTDHWVLDRSFPTETEARAYGKQVFARPRCEGYRVVRDWQKSPGCHFEAEIVVKFRPAFDVLSVTPIEDAPVCATDAEYYGVDARLAIGRLFRGYVERNVVTPTEILHNYPELKRLLDRDSLIQAALSRVAALQSGHGTTAGGTRRDDMAQTLGRLTERARTASALEDLPELKDGRFDPIFAALADRVAADDVGFYCRVVLSRDLIRMRNWLFKLDFLLELLEGVPPSGAEGAIPVLDGACADVLAVPPVLPALLGPQASLLESILNTLELCRGRLSPRLLPENTEPRLFRLNTALAGGSLKAGWTLKECRATLFDILRRQVKGTRPLVHGDNAAEDEAFSRLVASLIEPSGVAGGSGMAEALTSRFGRTLQVGGASGRRQAISGMLNRYRNAGDRLRYLLSLSGSEFGRQYTADIVEELRDLLGRFEDARGLLDEDAPLDTGLAGVTALYELALDSGLAPAERHKIADRIDRLLAAYIANHQVVDRLDTPEEHLRDRADRLVRLCTPGVLRSPRALYTLRQLVIGHLRQSGFDRAYVEGIAEPAAKRQALRDFHKLLSDAGLC